MQFAGPLRMALRAKFRGRVRIVSKAMARRLRARGIEVVDTAAVAPGPTADEFHAVAEMLRAEAPQPAVSTDSAVPRHAAQGEPVSGLGSPRETPATADLTDEELERLTAPDAE